MSVIIEVNGEAVTIDAEDVVRLEGVALRIATPAGVRSVMARGRDGRWKTLGRLLLRPRRGRVALRRTIGEVLDYRRSNLHTVRAGQQAAARGHAGYIGVSREPYRDLWRARIVVDGRRIYLGCYQRAEWAAAAYDLAARMLRGPRARTNATAVGRALAAACGSR